MSEKGGLGGGAGEALRWGVGINGVGRQVLLCMRAPARCRPQQRPAPKVGILVPAPKGGVTAMGARGAWPGQG